MRRILSGSLSVCVLLACSDGTSDLNAMRPSVAGMAGAGAGGTAASAGAAGQAIQGTAGSAGTASGGQTSGGSGGSASAGSAGVAGSIAGGTAGLGGSSGSAGAAGGVDAFPTADCAPGAIFCDDFEAYPVVPPFDAMGNLADLIKTGDTEPTWLAYHFHGPPRVDTSKPFSGLQNFHLDTETGHTAAADIIQEAPDGTDLWPATHYGRFMIWMKDVPPTSPFGLLSESGLLPGSTTETAQFTVAGVDGKLALMYTQRTRIYKNDASMPDMRRGGNDEMSDPGPSLQCTVAAMTQAIPAGQWVCVEWMLNKATSQMQVWLDGATQSDVDVVGGAASCGIGSATAWQAPDHWSELVLGFEMYGDDTNASAWEVWFDDFAIGRERLGCPAP